MIRLFEVIGAWIVSVVVVGLLLHVAGTLLTEKLKDWYASTSDARARKQIRRLEVNLRIVKSRNDRESYLILSSLKSLFIVLGRVSFGLILVLYPTDVSTFTWRLVSAAKVGLGIGSLLSAWIYIVLLALPDLDKAVDFEKYKTKTESRIARLNIVLQRGKTRQPD